MLSTLAARENDLENFHICLGRAQAPVFSYNFPDNANVQPGLRTPAPKPGTKSLGGPLTTALSHFSGSLLLQRAEVTKLYQAHDTGGKEA